MNRFITIACSVLAGLAACSNKEEMTMGTYGYDAQFLKEHGIELLELKSADGKARVMLAPAWQGRVVTSSSDGNGGDSYGWINYRFIESGSKSDQFNPVGGEERFWLGPEGGPYSLYFRQGDEQVYDNWKVPPVIDTETYEVAQHNDTSVTFTKHTTLTNASAASFDIGIRRTVNLLSPSSIEQRLGIKLDGKAQVVGYETINSITNTGSQQWTKDRGLVSIWMLGQFNPTPTTTVFIPYDESAEGKIVNDEYFGKIPSDRLKTAHGMLYFKIDGKLRSKLGIPPSRAKDICGSYDSQKGVLTIVKCTLPDTSATYLNGKWGHQDNPFDGDVINSYNDGPVEDGSIMGPFYEIETSSPGAELAPGATLTHQQAIIHIQADSAALEPIVEKLFGVKLSTISNMFK